MIDSFNDDKPYSKFVAEQLAGDEVPAADQNSWIATGFARNGPSNDDNMGKTESALSNIARTNWTMLSQLHRLSSGSNARLRAMSRPQERSLSDEDYYSLLAIFNGTEEFGQKPTNAAPKTKEPTKVDAEQSILARVERRAQVPATFVCDAAMHRTWALKYHLLYRKYWPASPSSFQSRPPMATLLFDVKLSPTGSQPHTTR